MIAPGNTVTIAIAPKARSYVVMSNPYSPPGGVVAATYHSCPGKWGFFAQSFTFTDGRIRGCVPMDIHVHGEPQIRHVTLSLFAGPCHS